MNTIVLVAFSFIAGMMAMCLFAWMDVQKFRHKCLHERDKRLKAEKALQRIRLIKEKSAR